MKISTTKLLKIIFQILGILIILLVIELLYLSNKNFYPSLLAISKSMINLFTNKLFYLSILKFILTITIVVVISFILSIIILLIGEYFNPFLSFITPIVAVFKSVPVVILTLIIWLIFNNKIGPYLVGFTATFPIIYEGLKNSFENIDPNIIKASLIDNTKEFNRVFKIKIPMNKNNMIMVILQALGVIIKVVITSEYIYQIKNSVGYFIKQAYDLSLMSDLIGWGIILTIIVIIIEKKI